MKTTEKVMSRRKLMLIAGGAVAGASALVAAPMRRNIKRVARRAVVGTGLGRSLLNLADSSFEEWQNEVGATFSLGVNTNLELVGVRALPTSGARPDNVRQQGFAAFFEPRSGQAVAPNRTYTVVHSSYGAMLLYLSGSSDPANPRRIVAVFN